MGAAILAQCWQDHPGGPEAKGTRSKAVKPVVRGRLCCHPLLLLLLLQGPAES